MRGTATWLLVGALAALGVAAGADALRSLGGPDRGASEPPAEPAPEAEPEPAGDALADARAELRSAGVPAGVLTYSDETCRLRSVTLPDNDPCHAEPDSSGRSATSISPPIASWS